MKSIVWICLIGIPWLFTVQGGPAMDLIAEKIGSIFAEQFKEKVGDLLAKRPCNCQLVMNPPPMPWYHKSTKHRKKHQQSP